MNSQHDVHPETKNRARARAREICKNIAHFPTLPPAEQMSLYSDVYHQELAQESSLASAMGTRGASTLIDEDRHQNHDLKEAADIGKDFIESVNFPQFVEDLLGAVFDANLNVTFKQMQAYQKLMQDATASLSKFVRDIDDTAAFGYLADKQSDEFSLIDDDEGKPALASKNGMKVDLGNNEIKAKIMDAKLAMAKEHRSLLREMILMGVSRLVVEKGTVNAAVVFDVKASNKREKKDMAQKNRQTNTGNTYGGGLGGLFGGRKTEATNETQISVSSAKSLSNTDMAAKMMGSVELQFKSDYFKLDNFAQMLQPNQTQGQTPATNNQLPASGQTPKPLPGQTQQAPVDRFFQ